MLYIGKGGGGILQSISIHTEAGSVLVLYIVHGEGDNSIGLCSYRGFAYTQRQGIFLDDTGIISYVPQVLSSLELIGCSLSQFVVCN